MVPKTLCTLLLAFGAATAGAQNSSPAHVKPSNESSRENANRIFNAIHSAGRQWGSSYYHNGFSFFPAVMPKGTVLYHGGSDNAVPTGPEWLAFEIEHAEGFAFSHKGRFRFPGGPPPGQKPPPKEGDPNDPNQPPPPPPSAQKPFSDEDDSRQELRRRGPGPGPGGPGRPGPGDDDGDDEDVNVRGYLHTYQATRDLELLYIDGMSAGKTSMGTLDSQDLLLRENATKHGRGGFDEYPRALDLCDLASEWGFDGVVRMEAGFEVILCDFSDGLRVVSMTRTAMPEDKVVGDGRMGGYMWARAIGERYNGLGDRLRLDFSSMVSALFFPVNISSTDAARPDLVRLEAAHPAQLRDIKGYLASVARQPRKFTVNWQAHVDLIVSRFARRMTTMAYEALPWKYFVEEVEVVTATWFDAPPLPNDISVAREEKTKDDLNRTADAIDRCRKNFLRAATIDREWWSDEDHLIFTAVDAVMAEVCENLFFVRGLLFHAAARSAQEEDRETNLQSAVKAGREIIQRLMFDLGWTVWKQTQPCPDDQALFIAMWPFGSSEDHWNPGCRTIDGLGRRGNSSSYWRMNFGGRPRGKPEKEHV